MNIKQKRILRKLVVKNAQKYSELMKGFIYEDKFAYHIKQLVKNKFINKRDGLYFLTNKGMQETAYFNRRTFADHRFKLSVVVMICKYKKFYRVNNHFSKDTTRQAYYAPPLGVMKFGEDLSDGCVRIIFEKYGIVGKPKFRSSAHIRTFTTDGKILFDDICLIYDIEVLKAPPNFDNWYKLDQIEKLKNRDPLVDRYILDDNRDRFLEINEVNNLGIDTRDLI